MDLNLKESLTNLEYLLEELFCSTTTNARKHEIQIELNSFKNTARSWSLCFYFLDHTTSQYVIMFALNTLESIVNEQWGSTHYTHKENLRSHLQNFLVEKGNTASYFLRGKYAKLLVCIAKHDWPSQYPGFFNFILELVKNDDSQLIGLILLKTTSEEFMGGVNFLENGRKNELARLLQQYIPIVFDILTSILENMGTKARHTVTATPPPSPTHPTTTPILPLVSTSFKPDCRSVSRATLETVQNLFTWVSINQIPPNMIRAIFNFTNISTYAQDDDDMCVLAISTINELLYRKCTPPGSLHFFTQLYSYIMELLRDLTNSSDYRIDTLDTYFMDKLSELLNLMIEQHFWRLEIDEDVSFCEFLSLLYQITIQLPSMQCYLTSLTIWQSFFKQQLKKNYSDIYLTLLSALLRKMHFSNNSIQLKEIDNVDVNDDGETDWQLFLKTTIEVIAMIAKQIPLETLQNILLPWQNSYDTYRQIGGIIDTSYNLNCDELEIEKLSFLLMDFSTLTQTLARLSPIYFDEQQEISKLTLPLINDLIEKLLNSAKLATNYRFFDLKTSNQYLRDCFINCHSQILAALKTYLIWITRNEKIPIENFKLLIDLILPIVHDSIPIKISNGAALLLLALSNLGTAPQIVVLNNVVEFINMAPQLNFIDKQTNLIVYSAIVNLLLKPCNLNRDFMTERFFKSLFWTFLDLTPSTNETIIWEITTRTLPILTYLIDFCKDFSIVAKKQLYLIIKPIIEHSVLLFPSYVKYTEISNLILVFFLNVLRVLQQQLGIEATKNSVQIFLDVAIKEHEASFFLEKLLQIFQLVIEAPGSNYKSFLPGILHLCMDNVYPFILQKNGQNPDDFIALLTLLHSILVHRWQYFYSSQVRLGYSPGFSETDTVEPKQLLAVLQVFGQALLDKDINIFRLSLASLEDLNTKWKLYLNVLYRFNSLSRYLNVLLDNLVNKSNDLLSEDVQIAVYNMASVSFEEFFATFLPQFIDNLFGLTGIQKQVLLQNFIQYHDKDMPTFIQRLQIFVSDIQSFRMCNLPSNLVD